MLEIINESCAAESKLCRAIERFPELAGVVEKFWYKGDLFYEINKVVMPNGLVQLPNRDHHNAV